MNAKEQAQAEAAEGAARLQAMLGVWVGMTRTADPADIVRSLASLSASGDQLERHLADVKADNSLGLRIEGEWVTRRQLEVAVWNTNAMAQHLRVLRNAANALQYSPVWEQVHPDEPTR